jgi:hypothetical protein
MTTVEILRRVVGSGAGELLLGSVGVVLGLAWAGFRRVVVCAMPLLLWAWASACLAAQSFSGESYRLWVEALGARVLAGAALLLVAGPLGASAGTLIGARRGAFWGVLGLGPFGAGLLASGVLALRAALGRAPAFHEALARADRFLACGALASLGVGVVLAGGLLRSGEPAGAHSATRSPAAGSAKTRFTPEVFVVTAWGAGLVQVTALVLALTAQLGWRGFFEDPRILPEWWRSPDLWLGGDVLVALVLVVSSHVVPYFVRARRVVPSFATRFGDRLSYREAPPVETVLLNGEAMAAAERRRAGLGMAWSTALSLAVVSIGVSRSVAPWEGRPDAELFLFFALSLGCVLTHGPRAARMARGLG